MTQFCTYFDGRYAARALLMLRSLSEALEGARVSALALDARALELARHVPPGVRVFRLDELVGEKPALAAAARSATPERGWLMALKAAWVAWVVERAPPGSSLTYVDADMVFLDSPAEALAETAGASIVLSPQRFTAGERGDEFWGRFNGGWLGVRHDATALAFLDAWQRDCAGRLSPDYSNQKFLDAVPARFPDVRVLSHPGVNLAHWNVGTVTFTEREGRVRVDGRPLVAYHMAGLFPLGFRRCATLLTRRQLAGVLKERVYAPYLRRLRDVALELGVAPVDALDRVQWPQTASERWWIRASLWRNWAGGGAVRY